MKALYDSGSPERKKSIDEKIAEFDIELEGMRVRQGELLKRFGVPMSAEGKDAGFLSRCDGEADAVAPEDVAEVVGTVDAQFAQSLIADANGSPDALDKRENLDWSQARKMFGVFVEDAPVEGDFVLSFPLTGESDSLVGEKAADESVEEEIPRQMRSDAMTGMEEVCEQEADTQGDAGGALDDYIHFDGNAIKNVSTQTLNYADATSDSASAKNTSAEEPPQLADNFVKEMPFTCEEKLYNEIFSENEAGSPDGEPIAEEGLQEDWKVFFAAGVICAFAIMGVFSMLGIGRGKR